MAGAAGIDLSHKLSAITSELQSAQGELETWPVISCISRRHTDILLACSETTVL
jgi:hypothetical protein